MKQVYYGGKHNLAYVYDYNRLIWVDYERDTGDIIDEVMYVCKNEVQLLICGSI
jgi:hypothetical protein